MNNILDYAMKMEKDGEFLYRDLANRTPDKGLKTIWNMLADEEIKHYEVFAAMKQNKNPKMPDSTLLRDSKTIFEEMRDYVSMDADNLSQREVFRKAQEMEQKSQEFYLKKASETSSQIEKSFLTKIANEEKKHIYLLEQIIEFITRPESWLEDAQWHHLEEY